MNNYPLIRIKDIVIQETGDEVLVYDTEENRAFCLNETSALVWQMCDGKTSISKMSADLSKKIGRTITEDFIWLAIDQLKKENLLVDADELQTNFKGLSRREVIRKVGLTSMVALPIVSSLVAPTATNAQSCVGAGGFAGFISCATTPPSPFPPCDCSPRSSNCCPGANAVPSTCNPAGPGVQTCSCVCQIP